MLYHLLGPLGEKYILFNPFNYITFRTVGAGVTAIVLAFVVGPPIIRRLQARNVGQVIRAEGPASHQSKRGTPSAQSRYPAAPVCPTAWSAKSWLFPSMTPRLP